MRIDVGAVLNLLLGQRHIQALGLQVRMDNGKWRDQYLPASKPAAGFYREVPDSPCLIVEIELIDGSKLSVRSLDRQTFHIRSFRQHVVAPPGAVIKLFSVSRIHTSRAILRPLLLLRPSTLSRLVGRVISMITRAFATSEAVAMNHQQVLAHL